MEVMHRKMSSEKSFHFILKLFIRIMQFWMCLTSGCDTCVCLADYVALNVDLLILFIVSLCCTSTLKLVESLERVRVGDGAELTSV